MTAKPRGALLVGSVPLSGPEKVFRTASAILGDRLRRLPDGETGDRTNWIRWQYYRLAARPDFEEIPATTGTVPPIPRLRLRPGAPVPAFDRLGYADVALASYDLFTRLRREGALPAGYRFQVCLPTPLAPVVTYLAPESQAAVEPAYEAQLLTELDEIVAAIPSADLAIQWDIAPEMALWEGIWPAPFADVPAGIIDRLTRLGQRVPEGVELGYHLCYGSSGNRHFVEPADTRNLVEVANRVFAAVSRPIEWLHLPVPIDRSDDAYFAPLRDLRLPPGTELYLGLLHLADGVPGADRRIAAARQVVPEFGVAAECGFGRQTPDVVLDTLRLHAEVAGPAA